MNVEEFREYCLSLPGVSEKMPFPNVADRYSRDVLCFYVGDKWFCFVNIEVFDFCCIKCRPEESTELRARYEGVKPGWHMNKKYWNSVYFNRGCTGQHYPRTGGTLLSAGCGEPAEEGAGALYPHALPIKVEHFEDSLLVCRLVETDVTHFFQ